MMQKDTAQNSKKSEIGRLQSIDLARGIGIILVLLVHSGFCGKKLSAVISAFYLSVFLILSGLLSAYRHDTQKELSLFCKKKLRSLMLPYLYFSVLQLMIHCIELLCGVFSKEALQRSVLDTLLCYGDSVLWFLPALFGAELLFYVLARFAQGLRLLLLSLFLGTAALLAYALLMNLLPLIGSEVLGAFTEDMLTLLLRIMVCASLVAVGHCIGELALLFDSFWRGRVRTLLLALVLFMVEGVLALQNGDVDLRSLHCGSIPLFYLSAVCGSFGLLSLCVWLCDLFGRRIVLRPFLFWGRGSLVIMCTHLSCYILYLAIRYAWLMDRFVPRAKSYVFLFHIALCAMLLETPLIWLVERCFPFLIGKKREADL